MGFVVLYGFDFWHGRTEMVTGKKFGVGVKAVKSEPRLRSRTG